MRILLVSHWYPPEPTRIFADLALSLQMLGHEVEVLTGFPNYPSGKLYPGYRIKLWQKEMLEGIPITRVPLYPDHSASGLKRILNHISFSLSASFLGPLLFRRPDIVYAMHPPTVAIPALLMSWLWRVPCVYHVLDMWPETLYSTNMVKSRLALNIVAIYLRSVYKLSKRIFVISPGFQKNLLSKSVPWHKIHVVSNWVDVDHYRPVDPNMLLKKKLGLSGYFNIMYAGAIGPAQGLETVIQAAELLRDFPAIQFSLVGDGISLDQLKAKTSALRLSNVNFLGWHPGSEMPQLISLADVMLVNLRDDPLFEVTIPHKIFVYMASGKAILGAVAGDAADVINLTHCGLTCKPGNAEMLAKTVFSFYSMSAESLIEMGRIGRRAACQLYSRDYLARKIEDVLKSVARGF